MRISDWSSDVCSSDLLHLRPASYPPCQDQRHLQLPNRRPSRLHRHQDRAAPNSSEYRWSLPAFLYGRLAPSPPTRSECHKNSAEKRPPLAAHWLRLLPITPDYTLRGRADCTPLTGPACRLN